MTWYYSQDKKSLMEAWVTEARNWYGMKTHGENPARSWSGFSNLWSHLGSKTLSQNIPQQAEEGKVHNTQL